MQALVIGGSGFIGSHVADELSENGFNVTIFDRELSKWKSDRQAFIQGDVEDLAALKAAAKSMDLVFNFAAIADIKNAAEAPLDTIRINVLGNANIVEACIHNEVNRYFFASTVYVHGREGSFYRCSKIAAEKYTEEYSRRFGLRYTILRYGSLYGPRSDKNNGIRRLLTDAVRERKLVSYWHPDAIREFIHVKDAARATVRMTNEEFINKAVILSGYSSLKIVDLLKTVGEILGIPEDEIIVDEDRHSNHYIRTPYYFESNSTYKYTPDLHVELCQGLMELIAEINGDDL
jgi:UDP-glucose 4-epimerase